MALLRAGQQYARDGGLAIALFTTLKEKSDEPFTISCIALVLRMRCVRSCLHSPLRDKIDKKASKFGIIASLEAFFIV